MTDYAEQIMKNAMLASTQGLDLETTGKAKQAAVEALLKQAEALRLADYPPKKFAEIARALAHTTKMLSVIGLPFTGVVRFPGRIGLQDRRKRTG